MVLSLISSSVLLSLSLSLCRTNRQTKQTEESEKSVVSQTLKPSFIMITVVMVLFYLMMLIIVPCNSRLCSGISSAEADKDPNITTAPALQSQQAYFAHGSCTNRDISISQSRGTSTGIPQYIVQIVNTCVSGCAPSNIHLHCGWFASARMVNPRIFKRLGYDDCLVNAGKPLRTSQVLRFTYSNSFMYPLGFKSANFC